MTFWRTKTGPYAHLPKEQPAAGELEDAASLFEEWSAESIKHSESSLERLLVQLAQDRQRRDLAQLAQERQERDGGDSDDMEDDMEDLRTSW